jgi:uncharacterized glyoxalase superfamily protein PhnB
MLIYADPAAAIDFLCAAFGFEVALRIDGPDGVVGHAELRLGGEYGAAVTLASPWRDVGLVPPDELPGLHGQIGIELDSSVDVDAHYERARAAGAVVIGEPTDQQYGHRSYRAVDPEGHHWYIGGPIG